MTDAHCSIPTGMSASHPLPQNPLLHPGRSPVREASPPVRGFSRSGFAPIPYRHVDLPPPPREREREREREFPRRDLDPEPEIERWERRIDREDWDRRPPVDRWEDDYGRFLSSSFFIFRCKAVHDMVDGTVPS